MELMHKMWKIRITLTMILCGVSLSTAQAGSDDSSSERSENFISRQFKQNPKPPAFRPFEAKKHTTLATLQRQFGRLVISYGRYYQKRAQYLRQICSQRRANHKVCHVYRRSQLIFAHTYRTSPKQYNSYCAVRSYRLPFWLRRWYRKKHSEKFKYPHGRCYLSEGMVSNCMSFAMCSQKAAIRNFHGTWGRGFNIPTWGYINYWTFQSYYRYRRAIAAMFRSKPYQSLRQFRRNSRILLLKIYRRYQRIVRRKRYYNRSVYNKSFCTIIVAGIFDFQNAIPGDIFGYAWIRSNRNMSFQHWGLILNPKKGKVLHNQTPGGMYGRRFSRWGIQEGRYSQQAIFNNKLNHKNGRRRVFFVQRMNLHFFQYVRRKGATIFKDRSHADICKSWIQQYAYLYFSKITKP